MPVLSGGKLRVLRGQRVSRRRDWAAFGKLFRFCEENRGFGVLFYGELRQVADCFEFLGKRRFRVVKKIAGGKLFQKSAPGMVGRSGYQAGNQGGIGCWDGFAIAGFFAIMGRVALPSRRMETAGKEHVIINWF